MKELSLNILDVAENSVKAGAKDIEISIVERGDRRTLTIADNGCGMKEAFLRTVTDPFTTTRTTRPVGLGLPLLKLAAEQTGGTMTVSSRHEDTHPSDHGTEVVATFFIGHLDCEPLGDVASTIVTLLQGHPDRHWRFTYSTDAGEKVLDTDEMHEMLGPDVPIDAPEVLVWAKEYWQEPIED